MNSAKFRSLLSINWIILIPTYKTLKIAFKIQIDQNLPVEGRRQTYALFRYCLR